MSTRSTIAVVNPDGKVRAIYCHYDGYLSHNGRILIENYTTLEKINSLMDLGDLSVLGEEIGEKHTYQEHNEHHRNCCFSYSRDNGENKTEAEDFRDVDLYRLTLQPQAYNYLFENGEWKVSRYKNRDYENLRNSETE